MDRSLEKKIRTVLDTVQILNPLTTRLILNENAGQVQNESLKTFFRGMNTTSLQETDFQFYRIMKNQKRIIIPSLTQSHLLSGLELKDASALFFPILTEYGYYGCFWACFSENDYSDQLCEAFANFTDWLTEILWNSQRNDFSVEAIAERYADFLDQLKTPALIVIYPDQVSISNPSFEAMNEKEQVLQAIRKGIHSDATFMDLINSYHCAIREIGFPGDKTGKIFQFHSDQQFEPTVSFNANEFEYFSLMIQKINGNLDLLETAGDLTLIQYNHKQKADTQLARLKTLIQYGKKHYRNFQNSREGAFEIVSVGDLIKEVVFDLKTVAKKRNLDILFDIEKFDGSQTQSGKVIGDAWLLTLMAFNLIENAIRYSKPDSKPVKVSLAYQIDNWKLTVDDSGIGISPLMWKGFWGIRSQRRKRRTSKPSMGWISSNM